MNILFVNACVRPGSRTKQLADYLLEKLEGTVTEVDLGKEDIQPLEQETLEQRNALLAAGQLDAPMLRYARQFAAADAIVVAAPYWDLSFPALLKAYVEAINVTGVTFVYTEEGRPRGLCQAKKLYYVTTAGGPILSDDYGYGYLESVCRMFYGITEAHQIKAQGLDIVGADAEAILEKARVEVDQLAAEMDSQ